MSSLLKKSRRKHVGPYEVRLELNMVNVSNAAGGPPIPRRSSHGFSFFSVFSFSTLPFVANKYCTQIGKIVGEGTFGKVHLGTNIFTQEKVRMRFFSISNCLGIVGRLA